MEGHAFGTEQNAGQNQTLCQLGDVIYAMPAMLGIQRALKATTIRLYITRDKPAHHHEGLKHPGGDVMVNEDMFDYLRPLLDAQPMIESIHYLKESKIPQDALDFDAVRMGSINTAAGNIIDYYLKLFGTFYGKESAWLTLPERPYVFMSYDVVIGRSARYNNDAIDYGLLAQLGRTMGFVGLPEEYRTFCARYGDLPVTHINTRHALDAAYAIATSKLYIGNQSLMFAIAEALKVPRLLEVFEPVPNVTPSGGTYGQFVTNLALGNLLNSLFGANVAVEGADLLAKGNYLLSR